jgi:hypothetical protein
MSKVTAATPDIKSLISSMVATKTARENKEVTLPFVPF